MWLYCVRAGWLLLSTVVEHNFFFFSSRRRHTRYWRDWSSDVCSSDLHAALAGVVGLGDGAALLCHMLAQRAYGRLQRPARVAQHAGLQHAARGIGFLGFLE